MYGLTDTKDEIEAQVDAMLQQGLIQLSTSPFNSPVLLVHKKDGSWRFCVDYCYLNALTIKTAFPIPIFEQLMDELAGAEYFSTLDLLLGYHQIKLQEGEEYKTAFSTHVGHYEFRVVAFGMSGAPGTFQGAMNTTLKPLLRRCAIVSWSTASRWKNMWNTYARFSRCFLRTIGISNYLSVGSPKQRFLIWATLSVLVALPPTARRLKL